VILAAPPLASQIQIWPSFTSTGAIARDRHKPGDRARAGLIEGRRLPPHIEINVLQHVFCLAAVVQDKEADAEKLRRRCVIDEAQSGAVAAGDPADGGGKLSAPRLSIHVSRVRAGWTWRRHDNDRRRHVYHGSPAKNMWARRSLAMTRSRSAAKVDPSVSGDRVGGTRAHS
jgi:hypothetical protein